MNLAAGFGNEIEERVKSSQCGSSKQGNHILFAVPKMKLRRAGSVDQNDNRCLYDCK